MLFQKRVVLIKLDIYVFISGVHLCFAGNCSYIFSLTGRKCCQPNKIKAKIGAILSAKYMQFIET
jgi:hypothetical protein